MHLVLWNDITRYRNNIGGLRRNTWAFIYFLTRAYLTLILWITGNLLNVLRCWMLLVYPSGSTPSLSVDDIKRLPCPWASSWIWLMRAFIWHLRERWKKDQSIYSLYSSPKYKKLLSVDPLYSFFVQGPVTILFLFISLSLGVIIALLYYQFWWFLYSLPSYL